MPEPAAYTGPIEVGMTFYWSDPFYDDADGLIVVTLVWTHNVEAISLLGLGDPGAYEPAWDELTSDFRKYARPAEVIEKPKGEEPASSEASD